LQSTDTYPLSLHDALPIYLATGVEAEERLDVELAAERVPQLLTAAVVDPGEQLVCGEAKGDGREKIERWRLLFEVVVDRVIHVRSEEHTSELQSPCNLVCR